MPSSPQVESKRAGRRNRDPRALTIVEAMREAMREEMRRDEEVFVLGEDIVVGGAFLVTLGLHDEFGSSRVINTPISEAGFVGLGIGAAAKGMRPIVDFQYGDFLYTAMDQIVQEGAKLRYMSGGQVKFPMVIQGPTGASGRGAQHANSLETAFFGVPGIKVVTPSAPYDAKGLMKAAIRDDNIVLYLVNKHLYGTRGRPVVHEATTVGLVPEDEYFVDIGLADVKRVGSDVTIVANGIMVHHALDLAKELDQSSGVQLEVVDVRTLVPMDTDTVFKSVVKTGRLIVAEEGNMRAGWGGWLVSTVLDRAWSSLRAAPVRVAAMDVPVPFSPSLEGVVIPSRQSLAAAVEAVSTA